MRKLALVLDLDHTLLHATQDARVREFGWDAACPDVRTIYLSLETKHRGAAAAAARKKPPSPHYVKLRPGVEKMLRDLHERYQLYIYTHGTRQYAEAVARVIDPTRAYFQGRIISRTDNPDGMHYKLLSQLFPCDDTMALILDDRTDVWPSDLNNLIKVKPYYFFHQMAEVNNAAGASITTGQAAALAPAAAASPAAPAPPPPPPPSSSSSLSSSSSIAPSSPAATPVMPASTARPVPDENDDEMVHVGRVLREIHTSFYGTDSNAILDADAQLQGHGPDVKQILRRIRRGVFKDVHVVFSAMIPRVLNRKPEDHPTWKQTEVFGACVSNQVKRGVTHVVARNPGTDKTMQAMDLGVWVVSPKWLERSISTWRRLPESEYTFVQLERHRRGKMEAGSAVFMSAPKPIVAPTAEAMPAAAVPAAAVPVAAVPAAVASESSEESSDDDNDEIDALEVLLLQGWN